MSSCLTDTWQPLWECQKNTLSSPASGASFTRKPGYSFFFTFPEWSPGVGQTAGHEEELTGVDPIEASSYMI